MLMAYNMDAASPTDVAMADLSSCNISCIPAGGSQPSSQYTGQQLSLQSFCNLVALDLSDNRLACFAGLAALPSLQQLNLSANRLRGLQSLQQPLSTVQRSSSVHVGGAHCDSSTGALGSSSLEECQLQQEAGCGDAEAEDTLTAAVSSHRCTQDTEPGVTDEHQQEADEAKEEAPVSHELGEPPDEGQEVQEVGQHAGTALQTDLEAHLYSSSYAGSKLHQPCMQLCGFSCLKVLDLSYNLLAAEQLLGQTSPLGLLPRQVLFVTIWYPYTSTQGSPGVCGVSTILLTTGFADIVTAVAASADTSLVAVQAM
jgi:Leucine-rich repeat (LRR) protein